MWPRNASLLAGLPYTIPGATVNRLCGSGLEAVNQAGRAVETDHGDLFVAGGVESMTRGPWVMGKPTAAFQRGDVQMFDSSLGWRFPNKRMGELYSLINNGETAENVADKYHISREDQDKLALASHKKAIKAQQDGRLKDEIVAVSIPQRKGAPVVHEKDEGPRADTSLEILAGLSPSVQKRWHGNRRQFLPAVGRRRGLTGHHTTKGRTIEVKTHGANYRFGHCRCASELYGDRTDSRDRESPQTRRPDHRPDRSGGIERGVRIAGARLRARTWYRSRETERQWRCIALGHPLGCSGARLVTTLLHEMRKRGSRYGLATMCIGVGQGIATVFERIH
jgi:acetyl-CoA acetyltransferase